MLVRVLIASGLCLAGINLAAVSSFVVSLTAVVLLAFVEPLFLRLWGTTPGKALLGMRLTGPDGKNVPYTEGLARYFLMMWYGQGFEIPGIRYEDMDKVNELLQPIIEGLKINQPEPGKGYSSSGTRNISACVGNKVCPYACYDTSGFAFKIEKAVFPDDLHVKVALTGCPNDCA